MSNAQVQLAPISGSLLDDPHNMEGDASSARVQRALEALRRHWMWAVPLALILSISGIVAGIHVVEPDYRSTGSILVKPVLPRVLYQTEDTGVMPMFSAFLESQIAVMRSQRVVDMAMQSPQWRDLGLGSGPEQTQEFMNGLDVSAPRNSGIILVSMTHKDPRIAAIGARAVVQAYERVYAEADSSQTSQTMRLLETRSTTLAAELRSLNERILEIAHEFGSASLERLYDFKLAELGKLESELQQVQVGIALLGGEPVTDLSQAGIEAEMDVDAIARIDQQMARLVARRVETVRRIELLGVRLLPGHRDVVMAQRELELYDKEIEEYASGFRMRMAEAGSSAEMASAAMGGQVSLEQLRTRERNLGLLAERARKETLELGRKGLQIQALQREITETEMRLSETRTRIEHLSVESGIGGRIEVMSYGEIPHTPFRDKRKQAAFGGGFAGLAAGLGCAILLGLTDRRFRSLADAVQSTRRVERLLGILPKLPSDLSDPVEVATAAHYVHQIRARLQIGVGAKSRAYAVTSSSAGSGKTSLALALGLSFAASGERTLLVDCDIVGGGLTRRLGAVVRRKLGQILVANKVITPTQLLEALSAARLENRRIGEILVRLGYATQEQIKKGMQLQEESSVGLMEALGGESLGNCVSDLDIPKLHVLPLGSAETPDISQLSPTALKRLLDSARAEYDVVLVDTGPVPGSIEASMITTQVDQAIMVLSSGEERVIAERALDYLLSLGVNVSGIVFNRADATDILSSGYASRASVREDVPASVEISGKRLGPVAQSVRTKPNRHNGEVYA